MFGWWNHQPKHSQNMCCYLLRNLYVFLRHQSNIWVCLKNWYHGFIHILSMLYILDYIIGYHGFIIENPWFQICFFHIFSIGFMAMMCCADIELIDVFFARPSWVPVRSLHASWIPEMAQTHTTTGETWWNCHAAIMYFENQKFGRLEPHFRHETLPLWISLIAHVLMVIKIQSAYWMPWAIPYVWWPINYHLGIVWKWSLHNTYI